MDMSSRKSRKTYYLDDEAYNCLWRMHKKTGKSMSELVSDAIRLTYGRVSQLSEEESKNIETIARKIASLFPPNFFKL